MHKDPAVCCLCSSPKAVNNTNLRSRRVSTPPSNMADGREKRKRGFLSNVWRRLHKGWWRRRWEPESPKTGVAGVSGQGRQVDRFVAIKPRCPGFTGPVIVGVVWKKQFVFSGE